MLATVVKHYIYDVGLNLMFDNIIGNFKIAPSKYIGNWFLVVDKEDGYAILGGLCTQLEGEFMVLEYDDSEYLVNIYEYYFYPSNKTECTDIMDDYTEEEDEFIKDHLNSLIDGVK